MTEKNMDIYGYLAMKEQFIDHLTRNSVAWLSHNIYMKRLDQYTKLLMISCEDKTSYLFLDKNLGQAIYGSLLPPTPECEMEDSVDKPEPVRMNWNSGGHIETYIHLSQPLSLHRG